MTERVAHAFKSDTFNHLYRIAALCNRAHWEEDPDAPEETKPTVRSTLLTMSVQPLR
jgi:hypothetical protein